MTPRTFLIVLVVLSACTPSSDQTSSSDPGQVEEAAVMGPTVSVDEIADEADGPERSAQQNQPPPAAHAVAGGAKTRSALRTPTWWIQEPGAVPPTSA